MGTWWQLNCTFTGKMIPGKMTANLCCCFLYWLLWSRGFPRKLWQSNFSGDGPKYLLGFLEYDHPRIIEDGSWMVVKCNWKPTSLSTRSKWGLCLLLASAALESGRGAVLASLSKNSSSELCDRLRGLYLARLKFNAAPSYFQTPAACLVSCCASC